MDESGRLQRAVSFFRISPQRTKAQEEEDKTNEDGIS